MTPKWELINFLIGGIFKNVFVIGQSVRTALCGVAPYYLGRIHTMNVTTAKDKKDGTNDNVEYKICSDVDDLCCKANPDSVTANEYQPGKTDKKKATNFGDCKKYLFKVYGRLYF